MVSFNSRSAPRSYSANLETAVEITSGTARHISAKVGPEPVKMQCTSVQLSLGSYPHLPLATLIYTDPSLGTLLGTRKARHTLRVVG
jgi:hypothetical protein